MDARQQAPAPIRIAPRFAGAIPGYGNGGIVAGISARYLGLPASTPVEVRIDRPVPLDTDLTVLRDDAGLRVERAGTRLATAVAAPRPPAGPPRVTAADVVDPVPVVPTDPHPAPGCFVCGPANPVGLNLQPGRIADGAVVATVWTPPHRLATADGVLPPLLVWAALDCPSWYGAAGGRPALLGTVRAHQLAPVPVDVPVVVTGWRTGGEGRKTFAGSALATTDGEPLAVASSTWIRPEELDR
jgi:hypothetical protein